MINYHKGWGGWRGGGGGGGGMYVYSICQVQKFMAKGDIDKHCIYSPDGRLVRNKIHLWEIIRNI